MLITIVADANVAFSSLISVGKPLIVFELNKIIPTFEFISPEYFFFEIGKRLDKLLKATHFSKEEFIKVFSFLKEEIDLIPFKVFEDKAGEAKTKASHLKDVPYVALALKLNCKIFSGDKGLKDALPNIVITPSEALNMIFSVDSSK
jgi:predicted nucleic acid-binding protein